MDFPKPLVDLSAREQTEYSICRAILATVDNRPCLEREVSDTIHDKLRESFRNGVVGLLAIGPARPRNSILIPTTQLGEAALQGRALLDTATATKGAELKFLSEGPFIEALRARSQVLALGATVLPGLRDDVDLVRQTGTGGGTWITESPTADVTASSLSLDRVPLRPRTIMSTTSASRKLVQQATPAVDALVGRDLADAFAVALDKAAIQGVGTVDPKGILNTAGIGSVTLGANGGVPIYDSFVDLQFSVGAADADRDSMSLGYLTTAKVRQRMQKSAQISAASGIPVWFNRSMCGERAAVSSNVPSNLTKGTSTTVCHAILFGTWQELVLADWGVLDLIVDPFTQRRRGDLELTGFYLADVAVRHAAAFAAVQDALP